MLLRVMKKFYQITVVPVTSISLHVLSLIIYLMLLFVVFLHMSRDARKPGFGISDLVRHKPGCTVSKDD